MPEGEALRRLGIATAFCAALTTSAMATDPGPSWTVTLGVEGRVLPRWEGSSRYTILPMPLLDIRRAGTPERFFGPRDGFAIGLVDTGQFRAGRSASCACRASRATTRGCPDLAILTGRSSWALSRNTGGCRGCARTPSCGRALADITA